MECDKSKHNLRVGQGKGLRKKPKNNWIERTWTELTSSSNGGNDGGVGHSL